MAACGCADGVHVECLLTVCVTRSAWRTCWVCKKPFRGAAVLEGLAREYAFSFEGASGPSTLVDHGRALIAYADQLRRAGKIAAAAPVARRAERILAVGGSDYVVDALALEEALAAAGGGGKALEDARKRRLAALEGVCAKSRDRDGDLEDAARTLGGALAAANRHGEALPLLRRAAKIREKRGAAAAETRSASLEDLERRRRHLAGRAADARAVALALCARRDFGAGALEAERAAGWLNEAAAAARDVARAYSLLSRLREAAGDRAGAMEAGVYEATAIARAGPGDVAAGDDLDCRSEPDVERAFARAEALGDLLARRTINIVRRVSKWVREKEDEPDEEDAVPEDWTAALCVGCGVRRGGHDAGVICVGCGGSLCGFCGDDFEARGDGVCAGCGALAFGKCADRDRYVAALRTLAEGEKVPDLRRATIWNFLAADHVAAGARKGGLSTRECFRDPAFRRKRPRRRDPEERRPLVQR